MQAAHKVIAEIYQQPITQNFVSGYTQEDTTSCGAYLIENIRIEVFQSIRKKQMNAQTLRQKHLDMLDSIHENLIDDEKPPKRPRANP